MANRPQDQQPSRRPGNPHPAEKDERDANEGADRNPPQPGHEAGSSGTSEYGRSDYGEPGDHEPESNEGSGRADRNESEPQKQSQSQKSSGAVQPPRVPSKQSQQ